MRVSGGMATSSNGNREIVYRRMRNNFDTYGLTPEQRERFETFVEERFANYTNPANTLLTYMAVLNHIANCIKKPFSDITMDDLYPVLQDWQKNSPAQM